MNVKGIFKLLITAVACVMVGAFVLNMLIPNALSVMTDTIENSIFNATGVSLNINANESSGNSEGEGQHEGTVSEIKGFDETGANVAGMEGSN